MAPDTRDDAYQRAQRDATFLSALRAAHEGEWDVLDALWWEANPEEPASSGAASPTTRLRDLQRRVFSSDGDAVGDHAITRSMQELEAEIFTEREALHSALASVQSGLRTEFVIPDTHPSEPPVDPMVDLPAPVVPTRRGRRSMFLVALGITVALLVGLAIGANMNAALVAAAPPSTASNASEVTTPTPVAALSVFDRAQTPEDIPASAMPKELAFDSFRALGVAAGSADLTVTGNIYAARNDSNMVCLVVLLADDDYLSTCTLEENFPVTGLRLYWNSQLEFRKPDGTTVTPTVGSYAVWRPDSSLETGAVGLATS